MNHLKRNLGGDILGRPNVAPGEKNSAVINLSLSAKRLTAATLKNSPFPLYSLLTSMGYQITKRNVFSFVFSFSF